MYLIHRIAEKVCPRAQASGMAEILGTRVAAVHRTAYLAVEVGKQHQISDRLTA